MPRFGIPMQVSIKRIRKSGEGEYDPADYLPVSDKNIDDMYKELLTVIDSLKSDHLKKLCEAFFVDDKDFVKNFKNSSAAKSVHHGFVGGLLEHTLSVVKLCDFYTTRYPLLKRDLLLTAAMLHDIGKVKEISPFPENDYTDDGQLLGHIVMGCEMAGEKIRSIEGFPLNFADNTDAKMETLTELFNSTPETGWLGFNRLIDSNVRKTGDVS